MSFGKYQPDHKGMAEFMVSKTVGDPMFKVAQDIAREANRVGRSEYQARPRLVTGGFDASDRAGAEVVDLNSGPHQSSPDGYPERVLVNLSNTYQMRGGG